MAEESHDSASPDGRDGSDGREQQELPVGRLRQQLRPVPQTSAPRYVVRTAGAAAQIRLRGVIQQFDRDWGAFAPARFTRAFPWYQARVMSYRVTDVLSMWRVPLPWWESSAEVDVSHGLSDGSSFLSPLSRTVWRIHARPDYAHHGCRNLVSHVFDIAHDPGDRWLLIRIHD